MRKERLPALLVAVLLAQLLAAEPMGHVLLSPDWLTNEADPDSSEVRQSGTLRLTIQTFIPLQDTRLTVTVPELAVVQPLTNPWAERFEFVPSPSDTQSLQIDLHDLDPANILYLDFDLNIAPPESGNATFAISGKSVNGRPVRHAVGVMVGQFPAKGVIKNNAIEFPAIATPTSSD